jgi:hypothetical protein
VTFALQTAASASSEEATADSRGHQQVVVGGGATIPRDGEHFTVRCRDRVLIGSMCPSLAAF